MCLSWVTHTFKRYARKAGRDPLLHLHSLPHSAATLALQDGVDVKSVSAILGHADTIATLNFYASYGIASPADTINFMWLIYSFFLISYGEASEWGLPLFALYAHCQACRIGNSGGKSMSRDWEEAFRAWSKPPSETEQERCDNAERMIGDAITNDETLSKMEIEVFPQGSYHHNTNVKLDSDVDICVRLMRPFFSQLPKDPPNTLEYFGLTPSKYTYSQFKDAVETALVNKFGRKGVTRGNKAFDIQENGYRIAADAVACLEHRRYTGNFDAQGNHEYLSGTQMTTDKGEKIINWPVQNYENGVVKNNLTGNRFKYIIRVLKRLRNEMQENEIVAADNIASFLIESWCGMSPMKGSVMMSTYLTSGMYLHIHATRPAISIHARNGVRLTN